ncbi:hypothetical protein EMCRGX_G032327 [Ephydatia muelleri]
MTDSVSLQDVLEESKELEKVANAVLGDSDDSCCTYSQGYVGRQALYACATCVGNEMAGICLACSLHCHDGHLLYELYTKRRFRCDCGNRKFPSDFKCKLQPIKDEENASNNYGQNYRGLYCSCSRPFPDPEDEVADDMLQCCVCEDWFHSRHLGTCPPDDEQYDEMVCDSCASHWPFLEVYSIHVWPSRVTKAAEKEDISLEVTGKEETHECLVARWKMVQDASQRPPLKTLYFSEGWRKRICKCPSCLERCCDADFLLDEEDSISAYERRGVAKGPPLDTHDAGMAAMLSTFDHTQQGYATMKENLVDFLKGFSDSGKVVTERDISDFFEGLKAKKRQRLDSGAGVPPSYCHQ